MKPERAPGGQDAFAARLRGSTLRPESPRPARNRYITWTRCRTSDVATTSGGESPFVQITPTEFQDVDVVSG